jgi:TonB family protein
MLRLIFASIVLSLLPASRTAAQEILVSEPQVILVDGYSTADEAPKITKKVLPEYPAEWLEKKLPHVATVGFALDAKGAIVRRDIDCERAVQGSLQDVLQQWTFSPAKLKRRNVPAICRVTIIFNSTRDQPANSDAPARLVAVSYAPQPAALEQALFSAYYQVKATIHADATVEVTDVQPTKTQLSRPAMREVVADPSLVSIARKMVESWQFTPARAGGKPVDSSIRLVAYVNNVNVLCGEQPKLISKKGDLEYPLSLRRTGNQGEVDVDFVVDEQGNVTKPKATKSSHPDFEAPAIAWVSKWKFSPGTIRGKPVKTSMRQPITFKISEETNDHGVDVFSIPAKSTAEMPVEYRYDQPPKPSLVVAPVYPFDLLKAGKKGYAEVIFVVGPKGTVEAAAAHGASSPEFSLAAVSAMRAWKFEPAKLNGKPTQTILSHRFDFDKANRDTGLDEAGADLLERIQKKPASIVGLKDLDTPIKPVYQVAPIYANGQGEGELLVEFYVDESGRARFPHATSTLSPELVYAGLTALARWQFTPPVRAGKPVTVLARIPIKFSPRPEAPKSETSSP